LDFGLNRFGIAYDDAWIGSVLWRAGQFEKYLVRAAALPFDYMHHIHSLVDLSNNT